MLNSTKRSHKKYLTWGHTIHSHLLNFLRQWVRKRILKAFWTEPKDLKPSQRQIHYRPQSIQWFKSGEEKLTVGKRYNVMDTSHCQKVWVRAYIIERAKRRFNIFLFLTRYFLSFIYFLFPKIINIKTSEHNKILFEDTT